MNEERRETSLMSKEIECYSLLHFHKLMCYIAIDHTDRFINFIRLTLWQVYSVVMVKNLQGEIPAKV